MHHHDGDDDRKGTGEGAWYRDPAQLVARLRESNGDEGAAGATVATALPPAAPSLEAVGHYRIRRIIASGGMGTVYEALQDHPRRPVAVKVLKRGLASRSALRRFRYESQVLARLRHPGIAQIYEAGTHDDGEGTVPWFAMEFIPHARPLTDHAREKDLSLRRRLELFTEVCAAVHHGHQKAIIHRDLKPSNILVDAEGRVKIIDFGVARGTDSDMALTTLQTSFGQLIGTLQYMSPEQCGGDPHDLDLRSDVYALGVVLYELLADALPYDVSGTTVLEGTRIIREHAPSRPSGIKPALRGDLETIILKALEKDRDRRYQSAAELGEDVRRYLNGEAITARPPSVVYQLRVFSRRHKAAAGAIAAVFVILVTASAISAGMYLRADSARADAVTARDDAVEAREAEAESRAAADAARSRAEQVAFVLQGMLQGIGPAVAQGRDPALLRELLDRAAMLVEERLVADPAAEATLRQTIGQAYFDVGEFEQANTMFREALELRRSVYGDDHVLVAESVTTLAYALMWNDWWTDDLELLCHEAVSLNRRLHGEVSRETARALYILGDLLRRRDRLGQFVANELARIDDPPLAALVQSEALHQEALEIYERLGHRDDHVAETMASLADLHMAMGDHDAAERLAREALAVIGEMAESNPHMNVYVLEIMAEVARSQGDEKEAERCFREAMNTYRLMSMFNHPWLDRAIGGLVQLLLSRGDLDGAESIRKDRVEWCRSRLGDDHWSTTLALRRLGWFYTSVSRHERAVTVFREVLKHVGTAATPADLDALRTSLLALGRTDEAREAGLEQIAIYADMGARDELDASKWNEYACLLLFIEPEDLRDPARAVPLAERAVESSTPGDGPDPHLHADALDTLAVAHSMLGNLDEAIAIEREALRMSAEVPPALGLANPDLTINMAEFLRQKGDDEGAERVLREALAAWPPEWHAVRSMLTISLVQLLEERGDLDAAAQVLREALATLPLEWSGSRERLTLSLVRLLEERGDLDAAVEYLRETVAAFRSAWPEEKSWLAVVLILQGRCLIKNGMFVEAESVLRECLDLRREALEPDHWGVGNAMSVLGEALAAQNKFEEAQPLLVEGYERIRDRASQIAPDYRVVRRRESIQRLVDLYDAWDRPAEAARWQAVLAELSPGAAAEGG